MSVIASKYKKMFDRLPIATKLILLGALLGLIFIIWYNLLWANLQKRSTITKDKLTSLEQIVPSLRKQSDLMSKELKNKQSAIYNQAALAKNMLSPEQTKKVLHDILKKNNNLVLLNFNNMPPKEVLLPKANLRVFEHGMVIKFLGDYFSTMDYLKAVEKLPWKLFWDRLEYKVTKYPSAEITLYIHTINTDDEWINV